MSTIVTNETCCVCSQRPSTVFCLCLTAPTRLCELCVVVHLGKFSRLAHQLLPIQAIGIDHEEFQRRSEGFAKGKEELLRNLEQADQFCGEVSETVDEMIRQLNTWRDEFIQEVKDSRRVFEIKAMAAIEEVQNSLHNDSNMFVNPLSAWLRDYTPGSLQFFISNVQVWKLEHLVPASYQWKEAGSVGPPRPEDLCSPVWTCRKCAYEYNLRETDVCSRCKSPRVDMLKPVRKEEDKASNPPVARPSFPNQISHDIAEVQFNADSDKRQNWKCGKCDYATNPVNATVCKRCFENKEEMQQELLSMRNKVLKKKTWKCDCGNTNTELAEVCSHCLDPRNKAAGEEAKRDHERKKKVAADQSSLDSPSKAAVPPSDTGAPWICPDCNTADRKGPKCSVCGRAKPVIRPPPSEPTSDQEKWRCERCYRDSRGNKCSACFNPTQPVSKIPVIMRGKNAPVGQWKCEHCGFAANMSTATKCYLCKKHK